MAPYVVLGGHSDVVYSVSRLSDNVLVSGSRDSHMMYWCIDDEDRSGEPAIAARASRAHSGAIRALAADQTSSRIFTLAANGYVKIWDASARDRPPLAGIELIDKNDAVCLAFDASYGTALVGSQNSVSTIDPRARSIVHAFDSLDHGAGVRSLSPNNGVVAIGGGLGRISFYDMRMQRYLSWQEAHSTRRNGETKRQVSVQSLQGDAACGAMPRSFMSAGKGWIDQSPTFTEFFGSADVPNAVYTLAYDDARRRLFAGGGPLQLVLRGSYAAIWE
nr:DDB1- and CUL4-associated factor 12 [Polyrhizophydium stewartii]